jgi:hypothetical protein
MSFWWERYARGWWKGKFFFVGGASAWRSGLALEMKFPDFTFSFCTTTLIPSFDADSVSSGMRVVLNRTEEMTASVERYLQEHEIA